MASISDLLATYIHHSELHFTDHWHTQTSVLSVLQYPLAISWQRFLTQWRFFTFPRSGPLVTAVREDVLSTDNSTSWVSVWPPFHTNLLVFSSQADFQLTTEHSHSPTSYFTSLHSTELPDNTNCTTWKHHSHCYTTTIPRPLHRNSCLFIRLLHSNGRCLQSHRLTMGLYATIT
jgi:hypothetical protein